MADEWGITMVKIKPIFANLVTKREYINTMDIHANSQAPYPSKASFSDQSSMKMTTSLSAAYPNAGQTFHHSYLF